MDSIEASPETLSEQAPGIVVTYLAESVDRIDSCFGEGYAQKHPNLIGAFIIACAMDVCVVTLSQQLRAGLREVAEAN